MPRPPLPGMERMMEHEDKMLDYLGKTIFRAWQIFLTGVTGSLLESRRTYIPIVLRGNLKNLRTYLELLRGCVSGLVSLPRHCLENQCHPRKRRLVIRDSMPSLQRLSEPA